jgi:hypothetical protein
MTSTTKFAVDTVSSVLKRFSTKKPADLVVQDTIALRTIIQMLSIIEKANVDLKKPANIFSTLKDETQVRELKVLSALAVVLVKEHETVAVVAKRDDDPEGSVKALPLTDISGADESTTKSFPEHLRNFVVTINPRADAEPDGPQTYPTILETMWSDPPKEPTLDELKTDAIKNW